MRARASLTALILPITLRRVSRTERSWRNLTANAGQYDASLGHDAYGLPWRVDSLAPLLYNLYIANEPFGLRQSAQIAEHLHENRHSSMLFA
jgi:hypothetical protein